MTQSISTDTTGGEAPCKPIEATEAYRNKFPVAYEQSKLPFDTPRKIKVILAGAGISGISFAHAVESGQLPNVDLQILEKNAGLGGTWLENRYPGCACDIPSHNYLVCPLKPLHVSLNIDFFFSLHGRQIPNGVHFTSPHQRSFNISTM